MLSPEEIRNQCEDDADRAPSDLTVWRDRGAIIAAQQTRIAELEAQIARVEAVVAQAGDLDNGILVWDLRAALDWTCGCADHPDRFAFSDGDPHGCYCTCADTDSPNCTHKVAS